MSAEYRYPKRAIVSIWHRAVGGSGEFIGSGAFISPRLVLTAKHVVDQDLYPNGFYLDLVDGYGSVPAKTIHTHPVCDIALIDLEKEFSDQNLVRPDWGSADLAGKKVDFYGVNRFSKARDENRDHTVGTWHPELNGYLCDHQVLKGFSGGAAVVDGVAVGVIIERHESDQQTLFVPLYLAYEWFKALCPLQLPVTPLAQAYQIPQHELTSKIKNQIRSLLNEPRAQPLQEAIVQRADGKSALEALIPPPPDTLIEALDLLHLATKDCLQQLKEQNAEMIRQTKEVAGKILGWLVLLAVDKDQLDASGFAFDPWQGGIEIAIPLVSAAGTEVVVSSLGERAAWLKLKYDNKNRPQVVGKDCFTADGLEDGIAQNDQLLGIQKRIWVEVMKSEAPIPFGPQGQKRLQAKLAGRERRKESHYYITVPSDHTSSPFSDKALLKSLLQVLPSLRVIYIGGEQGEGLLLLDEYDLWESIEAFLIMLRDTP